MGRCRGAASIRSSLASQIVTALQTIVSRSVDITRAPAVVTVGQFQAGVRHNIIPDTARLVGTIRTFDDEVQADIHARVKRIAEASPSGAGATVDVRIDKNTPVTANDPALTARMLPTLERVAPGKVQESELITGAEDYAFYQREVPGLFFFLGITPPAEVGKRAGESLAVLLRRRIGADHRRPRTDPPRRRLSCRRRPPLTSGTADPGSAPIARQGNSFDLLTAESDRHAQFYWIFCVSWPWRVPLLLTDAWTHR